MNATYVPLNTNVNVAMPVNILGGLLLTPRGNILNQGNEIPMVNAITVNANTDDIKDNEIEH